LTTLWPTFYGARHHGQVLVAAAIYGAVGLGMLWKRAPAVVGVMVAATVVAATALTARAIPRNRGEVLDIDVVGWVQHNIREGTRVYWTSDVPGMVLPTAEAANRIWEDVAAPRGFESEFKWRMGQLGLPTQEPVRACAADWMVKEQGLKRGLYILGGRGNVGIPRYDLYQPMIHAEPMTVPREGEWVLGTTVAGIGDMQPVVCWVHKGTVRAAIYCSPSIEKTIPKDARRGRIEF
jgi:hypothetical protein